MKDSFPQISNQDLQQSPNKIAKLLLELIKSINENKKDIESIRDRDWWDRIWANNSKDLAEAMLKQNQSIELFTHVVQQIILLNRFNIYELRSIQMQINENEFARRNESGKYIKQANDLLCQAIAIAELEHNKSKNKNYIILGLFTTVILIFIYVKFYT